MVFSCSSRCRHDVYKSHTHGGTRTRNLLLRRQTPYPLGHAGGRSHTHTILIPTHITHHTQPLHHTKLNNQSTYTFITCPIHEHTSQPTNQQNHLTNNHTRVGTAHAQTRTHSRAPTQSRTLRHTLQHPNAPTTAKYQHLALLIHLIHCINFSLPLTQLLARYLPRSRPLSLSLALT